MADLYLHARLSEEVLKELDFNVEKNMVLMGAQGPDPLYYKVGKNGTEYRNLANAMHDKNTQMLFKNMVTFIKHNKSDIAFSHLVGFICHYALDVKIHPYVYNQAGIYKKDDPKTHLYKGQHLKFERSIDAVKIIEEQNKKPNKLKLHKMYFPIKMVPVEVVNVMNHTLKQTYGKDHGGVMYLMGVNKMHWNIKHMVYDRFGLKKLLFRFLDLFRDEDLFLTDISFANHIENYDYLNNKKNNWHHPVSNDVFNHTVDELFEQARVFALDIVKKCREYIYDDKDIDLNNLFTNLSFNTGLNCDLHAKMQHFNFYRK